MDRKRLPHSLVRQKTNALLTVRHTLRHKHSLCRKFNSRCASDTVSQRADLDYCASLVWNVFFCNLCNCFGLCYFWNYQFITSLFLCTGLFISSERAPINAVVAHYCLERPPLVGHRADVHRQYRSNFRHPPFRYLYVTVRKEERAFG